MKRILMTLLVVAVILAPSAVFAQAKTCCLKAACPCACGCDKGSACTCKADCLKEGQCMCAKSAESKTCDCASKKDK